ncbi:MAG: DUF11 domain-containing protein, partial [Lachnospiraceae bacterium]|nr:DUF11 domain-containing protein [Lachnospiraceae bacterium]
NTASVQIGNDPAVDTNTAENPITPDDPTDPTKTITTEGVEEGDTVKAGDVLTYSIGFYNHTNKVATVVITDTLEGGIDYISSTEGGVYDEATRTVTWTLTVNPFTEGSVSVTVEVNESAETQISNTAYVKIGNEADSDTDTENPGGSDEPDNGTPTNTVTNPVEEEEIPTTTPAPTEPIPTTGDTEAVVPYTVLMLMAFAAIVMLLKGRRKENA